MFNQLNVKSMFNQHKNPNNIHKSEYFISDLFLFKVLYMDIPFLYSQQWVSDVK